LVVLPWGFTVTINYYLRILLRKQTVAHASGSESKPESQPSLTHPALKDISANDLAWSRRFSASKLCITFNIENSKALAIHLNIVCMTFNNHYNSSWFILPPL